MCIAFNHLCDVCNRRRSEALAITISGLAQRNKRREAARLCDLHLVVLAQREIGEARRCFTLHFDALRTRRENQGLKASFLYNLNTKIRVRSETAQRGDGLELGTNKYLIN
jgi:hypothetical protein